MNKTAKIIIAVLLISNLLLVGFLFMGKNKKHQRKIPSEIIIEKLRFDDSQQSSYQELIEVHRKSVQKTHEKIVKTKNRFYKSLKDESPSINDSLRNEIIKGIKEIETLHFNHFQYIKELCSDSQKEKFNNMVDELSTIFQPKRRPKNKRHGK